MSKQVEVPRGVQRFDPEFDDAAEAPNGQGIVMLPWGEGDWIHVSDLGAIYKHFSDRLLSDEAVEAMALTARNELQTVLAKAQSSLGVKG